MRFDLITLLPEAVAAFAALGVTGEALRSDKAQLESRQLGGLLLKNALVSLVVNSA